MVRTYAFRHVPSPCSTPPLQCSKFRTSSLHALPICGVFVLQSAELGYYRSYIDDGKRIDNNILTKNTVF